MSLWVLLVLFGICVLIRYHWRRRHLYSLASHFSGPPSLPLIGCAHCFLFCTHHDILDKVYTMIRTYGDVVRFWFGPELILCFKNPKHVEKILCSTKFSHKHGIYDITKDVLGEGLIATSGFKHRKNKKIIQPLFNLQFSSDCAQIFEKYIPVLVTKLERMVGENYFDIGHLIHLCASDVMAEVIFGLEFDTLNHQNLDYINGFNRLYKLYSERMVKPWLHPDFIFKRTSLGKEAAAICDATTKLMQRVIDESRQRVKNGGSTNYNSPVSDILTREDFEDYELKSHLITLFMASDDTIALIVSATCFCLAMYPEYQKKVVEEIGQVFEPDDSIAVEKISTLCYLDMCVKETYRIFPIGPYIIRTTIQDEQVDDMFLPNGCGILIPIYNLHHDPKYWNNPEHFHPDHFLPEVEKSRPSYTYVPFSSGPRSCIGKIFANISVKVMLIRLLQKFEFHATGKLPDVKFTMDLSVRALNGYNVKITKRKHV